MHNRRLSPILALFFALLIHTSASVNAAESMTTRAEGATALGSVIVDRSAELARGLTRVGASAELRSSAISQFGKLPVELQSAVLARLQTGAPIKAALVPSAVGTKVPIEIIRSLLYSPSIADIIPAKAGWHEWVQVRGTLFTADCVVKFDKVEQPTTRYLDGLWFKVPSLYSDVGKTFGVSVLDKATKLEGLPVDFPVIAPREYRGVSGWQFPNFSSGDLSWAIFRDYFTQPAVEYAPGKPRQSAWNWYLSTYKGIAHGGDCFGMSVRSVRTRRKDFSGLWASWWPSHTQARVWDYLWVDPQIGDSIREDQGGQLSREVASLIDDRWNHQSHFAAANMIWSAIGSGDSNKQPIVCMWIGNNYGHAVVCYGIAYGQSKYHLSLYDNNKPYTEMGNPADSIAYVGGYGGGWFSYFYGPNWPAANKMIVLLYNEIALSPPHLPAEAGGTTGTTGTGMDCTIAAFDSQNAVQQITDESGHTFFANGQENTNSATRIPDSMRFIPLTGGKLPYDGPAIFIFNRSVGKSLTFDTVGTAPGNARIFSPGSVTALNLRSGQFSLRNIMQQTQELNLNSPNLMQLQSVEMISVQPDRSERVFQMKDFRNLTPGTLKFSLSPTLDSLNASGIPAKFALAIQGQSSAGIRSATMPDVAIPAGRMAAIKVPDFRTLQDSSLQMETR
jgi:hypothetical protein